MYKFFGFLILAFFLYAANLGFFRNFELFGAVPNLLMLLIVYMALEEEGHFFLGFAFFAGLILDFSTDAALGSFSLAFFLLAAVLRRVSQNVISIERNWKFLPLMVFIAQLLTYVWIYVLNALAFKLGFGTNTFEVRHLFNRFGWELAYNLIVLYAVWKAAEVPQILQNKFSPRIK